MAPLKIVLANRANAFAINGGDTVVMRQLQTGLQARGHYVTTEVSDASVRDADVVHIVNLTIRESESFAQLAIALHTPYVVTALYEDWPLYINKSLQAIASFHRYLASGQRREILDEELQRIRSVSGGPTLDRQSVVDNAALLFACGAHEADRLSARYPQANGRVEIAPFGVDGLPAPTIERVKRMKARVPNTPFVLCCGRIETRKNQLMLLAALEDSELPIVLAAGGGSVQPVYVDLVKRFKRRAPVMIFGELEREDLSALMSLAAVHVLPSWYELPGLVTLEAVQLGTRVVASNWGAIRDYLAHDQFTSCEPDDPDSIARAVKIALAASPPDMEVIRPHLPTWQSFVDKTLGAYEQVLGALRSPAVKTSSSQSIQMFDINVPELPMKEPLAKMHRFDASIIIPCFNRAQLTKECVEAMCQDEPSANYEVLFVDNGSTDDTPAILKAIEGDVKVIRFNQNRGFAAACNQAACLAEGKYLVFLNNDTRPQAGWLDALIASADKAVNAGAVGSLLLYPDGTVQHAGIAVNSKKVPYHIFQNFAPNEPAVNEQREMIAVTGACMLVNTQVFQQIGGFDEAYLNGFEDVDLCLRLKEAGYANIYCPASKVVHLEESSPGRKDNDRANFERFMNRWSATLAPDEQQFTTRFGYTIEWTATGGKYQRLATNSAVSTTDINATADNLLAVAKTLYASGRYNEAADTLQSVVEKSMTLAGEDGFETWQTLGNCLARLNRAAEAEGAFYQAMKLNGASERPYLGLGTLALIEENWLAAQYSFMMALAKNPDATKGEFGVGVSLSARNRHEAALDYFARVVKKEPLNEEALFYYYRSALEVDKPDLAIAPLENYVFKRPEDTTFLFHLCGAYWKAGQVLKAVEMCERVLNLDPAHEAAQEIYKHFEQSLAVNA